MKLLSHVQLFATPWTVAYQAPSSMRFSRQEYWSGLPFPSPGDLPDPGIQPGSPPLEADALTSEPPGLIFLFIHILKEPAFGLIFYPPHCFPIFSFIDSCFNFYFCLHLTLCLNYLFYFLFPKVKALIIIVDLFLF